MSQLNEMIGLHVATKFRRLARIGGVYQTARRMRKDGYTLTVALLILRGVQS
jgi:hypothetical protein